MSIAAVASSYDGSLANAAAFASCEDWVKDTIIVDFELVVLTKAAVVDGDIVRVVVVGYGKENEMSCSHLNWSGRTLSPG